MLTSIIDFVANIILMPGDFVCRFLKVKDPANQNLLRIYINLFIYGKMAILWVFWYLNF